MSDPPTLPALTMAAKAESVASITSQCSFSSTIVHVGDKKPPESGGNGQNAQTQSPEGLCVFILPHLSVTFNKSDSMKLKRLFAGNLFFISWREASASSSSCFSSLFPLTKVDRLLTLAAMRSC